MEIKDQQLINEHLANERTFLAWIRTGVGIMASGFVVVKFSLFMSALSGREDAVQQTESNIASQSIGIFLVALGAFATLVSYFRYKKTVRLMRKGTYQYSAFILTLLAVAVVASSILLIIYLASSAGTPKLIVPSPTSLN